MPTSPPSSTSSSKHTSPTDSTPQLTFQPRTAQIPPKHDRHATIKASNYTRASSSTALVSPALPQRGQIVSNLKALAESNPSEGHGFLHNFTKLVPHHAIFQAKVTVHQLSSVPLVRGEFAVKWKFKNAYSKKVDKLLRRMRKVRDRDKDKDKDKSKSEKDKHDAGENHSNHKDDSDHDEDDDTDDSGDQEHSSNHSTSGGDGGNRFAIPSLVINSSSPPGTPSTPNGRSHHRALPMSYSSSSISHKPLYNPYAEYLASDTTRPSTRPNTPSRPNWSFADSMAAESGSVTPNPDVEQTPAKGMTKYMPLKDHNVKYEETLSLPISIRIGRLDRNGSTSSLADTAPTTPPHSPNTSSPDPNSPTHPIAMTEKNGYYPGPDGRGGLLQPSLVLFTIQQHVVHGDPFAPKNPVLGTVELDLAQYASAGKVTRKHLLRDSRTNATLQVTVEMEFIGGQRTFICPPLPKAEILGGVAGLLENETYRNAPRTLALLAAPLSAPPALHTPKALGQKKVHAHGSRQTSVRPSPNHSRAGSVTGAKPAFHLAEIPAAVGPHQTEALIDALFNPTPTTSKRPSPFTYYAPRTNSLDVNLEVMPVHDSSQVSVGSGLANLPPEAAQQALEFAKEEREQEEEGIGLAELIQPISASASSSSTDLTITETELEEIPVPEEEGDEEGEGEDADEVVASPEEEKAEEDKLKKAGKDKPPEPPMKLSFWARHFRSHRSHPGHSKTKSDRPFRRGTA